MKAIFFSITLLDIFILEEVLKGVSTHKHFLLEQTRWMAKAVPIRKS
jgi:hypothetical protein